MLCFALIFRILQFYILFYITGLCFLKPQLLINICDDQKIQKLWKEEWKIFELLFPEIVILNNVNLLHLFCSFQLNVAQELKDLVWKIFIYQGFPYLIWKLVHMKAYAY